MEGTLRWQHILIDTIQKALITYIWIEEYQSLYEKKFEQKQHAALFVERIRVLCDIFSVYVTSIVSGGGSSKKWACLKTYIPEVYKDIKDIDIIKKCNNHRHNRSAHNICHTGHIVQPQDILNSDIKKILDDILADIMCYHNK